MTGTPVDTPDFLRVQRGIVTVTVRLTPRASRTTITGFAADPAGGTAVKAAVTAVPEAGKANAALLRLLAKEWRLPRSSLTIAAGAGDRRKTVAVAGDPDAIAARLTDWAAVHPGNAGAQRA